MAIDNTRTRYSEKIKGDKRNYDWLARFDMTGGYLGITQLEGETVKDRVLLSPAQVKELLDFVGKRNRTAAQPHNR